MKRKNKVLAAFLTSCLLISLIPTGLVEAASKKEVTAPAQFYYVRNNHNAGSNSASDFGGKIGDGTLIITGLSLSSSNQNYALGGDGSRIKEWPAEYPNGNVPKNSKAWTSIVNNEYDGYQPSLAGKCIKSIIMIPYKISYNYDGYHLDSTLSIVAKHSFGEWTIVEPTCTESGKKERICETCGQKETETYTPLGHDLITDEAVSASCDHTGLTEGNHCSRCDYSTPQEVVPVLEPAWGEWTRTKEPTVDEPGTQERVCTHCDGTVAGHRQEAFVFLEEKEVEVEVEVPVEVEKEIIVEIEKEVEVEKEVIKEIEVPVPVPVVVEVEVEKEVIVEVPSEPIIVEVPVPAETIVENEEEVTIEEIVEEESAEAPLPGPAQIETRYVYVNVPGPVQTVEVEHIVEVEVPTAAATVLDDADTTDTIDIEDEETPLASGMEKDEVDFHCCHLHFLLLIDILCFMICDLCSMIMRKNKIIKQLEEEKENDL